MGWLVLPRQPNKRGLKSGMNVAFGVLSAVTFCCHCRWGEAKSRQLLRRVWHFPAEDVWNCMVVKQAFAGKQAQQKLWLGEIRLAHSLSSSQISPSVLWIAVHLQFLSHEFYDAHYSFFCEAVSWWEMCVRSPFLSNVCSWSLVRIAKLMASLAALSTSECKRLWNIWHTHTHTDWNRFVSAITAPQLWRKNWTCSFGQSEAVKHWEMTKVEFSGISFLWQK